MYPDRLYDLAFAFKKTKLWKRLYDTELFAVSLPNGEIGYCSIMGFLGEHLALALYVGNRGLDSYRRLSGSDMRGMNPLKARELMVCQNCLQCSFEVKDELTPEELSSVRSYASSHGISLRGTRAFAQFSLYQEAHYPRHVSEREDIDLLCTALEAALAVSEKLEHTGKYRLGFREGSAYDRSVPLLIPSGEGFSWSLHPLPPQETVEYPEPVLRDDLLMARLRRVKKRGGIWICDVVMIPQPSIDPESSLPVFPYTLLTAKYETGEALLSDVVSNLENGAEALLRALGNQMLEHGIPREIWVVDDRTYALIKNFAASLKIRLVPHPEDQLLDEMEADFLDYFSGDAPYASEDEIELLSDMLMMMDDATLLSMPDDMWEQLCSLAHQGLLNSDLAERIRKLQKR